MCLFRSTSIISSDAAYAAGNSIELGGCRNLVMLSYPSFSTTLFLLGKCCQIAFTSPHSEFRKMSRKRVFNSCASCVNDDCFEVALFSSTSSSLSVRALVLFAFLSPLSFCLLYVCAQSSKFKLSFFSLVLYYSLFCSSDKSMIDFDCQCKSS